MNTPCIRAAAPADLEHIQRVEAEAARLFAPGDLPVSLASPTPLDELDACCSAASAWVAVEYGFGIVGFIAARAAGSSLHIVEMDVLPSHGQRGIGSRLLGHVCTLARERGHGHVTLTTFAHLPWNAPFYFKYGFREVIEFDEFPHLGAVLARERSQGLERRLAMAKSAACPAVEFCGRG